MYYRFQLFISLKELRTKYDLMQLIKTEIDELVKIVEVLTMTWCIAKFAIIKIEKVKSNKWFKRLRLSSRKINQASSMQAWVKEVSWKDVYYHQ